MRSAAWICPSGPVDRILLLTSQMALVRVLHLLDDSVLSPMLGTTLYPPIHWFSCLGYLELSSFAGNLRTLSDGRGSLRRPLDLILGRERLTQNRSDSQGPQNPAFPSDGRERRVLLAERLSCTVSSVQ